MFREEIVQIVRQSLSNIIFQVRRGTTAQWAASTRPLRDGEQGWNKTTKQMYIGNGVKLYPDYDVVAGSGASSGNLSLVTIDTGETYKIIGFSNNTLKAVPATANPPQPPSNLTKTVRLSSVSLAWTASPTPGARYDIFRNGAKIGSTTGVAFKDPNIATGSTYSYHIVATDVYGQPSNPSASVSAFIDPTLNAPPTVEVTTWPSPLPASGRGIIRVCGKDPDAQSLAYSLSVDEGLIEATDDPSVWNYTAGG